MFNLRRLLLYAREVFDAVAAKVYIVTRDVMRENALCLPTLGEKGGPRTIDPRELELDP